MSQPRHSPRTCRIWPDPATLLVQSAASLQRFATGSDGAFARKRAFIYRALPLDRRPVNRAPRERSRQAIPSEDSLTKLTKRRSGEADQKPRLSRIIFSNGDLGDLPELVPVRPVDARIATMLQNPVAACATDRASRISV